MSCKYAIQPLSCKSIYFMNDLSLTMVACYPLLSLRYKSCVTENVTHCGKSPDKRSCLRERCKSHTTALLSSRQRRRIKRHCSRCISVSCEKHRLFRLLAELKKHWSHYFFRNQRAGWKILASHADVTPFSFVGKKCLTKP